MISLLLAAAGWIAFIAPDIPQAHGIQKEYEARLAPVLRQHDLEVRFVPLADDYRANHVPAIAAAVAAKPRLIVAPAHQAAMVARQLAGEVIPVVFSTRADPVRTGLVASHSRPGGNLTGISYDVDIAYKQLELLKQIAPHARTVGVLADTVWLQEEIGPEDLRRYERQLGLRLTVMTAATTQDLLALTASREAAGVDAWLVPISNTSGGARNEVVAAIRASGKPAIYGRSFFVDAGGLASYHEVIADPVAILADMSKRILDGTSAGEIPVRRPNRFELVLNLEEAKRLGIVLPRSLVKRADRIVGAPPSP